jgi:hypothetical protein
MHYLYLLCVLKVTLTIHIAHILKDFGSVSVMQCALMRNRSTKNCLHEENLTLYMNHLTVDNLILFGCACSENLMISYYRC